MWPPFFALALIDFHGRVAVGLIEAYMGRIEHRTESKFPRPRGRGLIEAGLMIVGMVLYYHFHGRVAVASLKRNERREQHVIRRISTAAWPWPH